MASGEHDFMPSTTLFARLLPEIELKNSAYGPLRGLEDAIGAVAEFQSAQHGCAVPPSYVTFVPSVSIALALSFNALVSAGEHVIIIGSPVYYSIYSPLSSASASISVIPFLSTGRVDVDRIAASITDKTKLIIVVNPHSPTGTVYIQEDLWQVGELCSKHRIVALSDEVYEYFVIDGVHVPLYSAHPYFRDNAIVISSYGKCYGVSGFVAAFVVAGSSLLHQIERYYGGPIFMTSRLSQYTALGCTTEPAWIPTLRERLRVARDRLAAGLATLPMLRFVKPNGGMFLWLEYLSPSEPLDLSALLLRKTQIETYSARMFIPENLLCTRLNFATELSILDECIGRITRRLT
jgi:N-succinyldiaminopimelate aminotransferase